jgi:hypothetical protein
MTKKIVSLVLLGIFLITSGCATIAGTAAGPITGTVSCAKKAVETNPGMLFLLPVFPVAGIINGLVSGLETDTKTEPDQERLAGHRRRLFDPCEAF